ncbi:MAG: efflux RND transporter periplasmic adaptor subunit [Acidobacteriota bacterium]|nr:efflux RND transporter periplasmic adaptor subunit [Acidobacteriota bacterium]
MAEAYHASPVVRHHAARFPFILAGAAVLTACGHSAPATVSAAAPSAMPVSVVEARTSDVSLRNEWVGTLDGYVNAQIQPQVSGYLVKQDYREGQVVTKGEVLFEIDQRPFRAALAQANGQIGQAEGQTAQAEGQLAQAEAQLRLARINVDRDTPLAAQRAVAQSQLDNEKQQLAQAEANVKTAQGAIAAARAAVATAHANADAAQLNLDFTQVRSLIGGVAGQATTQVGNLVGPQSVLTSVSQLDPIKVYFSISDEEYLALAKNAATKGPDLLHSDVPLTLTLADGSVFAHEGRIDFVDRQMNQQTGAIRIAASFANPGNVLRPGQFARVSATTRVLHDALLVPQAAVTDLQGVKQLYIVAASGAAHVVNVTLGPQYGTDWIVTGGIAAGAEVITDNLQKLREGTPVTPRAGRPAGN